MNLLTETRQRLSSGELKAAALMAISSRDDQPSLQEMAAWFAVTRALLNLDETITRE